ncbi:MAG: threonine aldolase family protein [Planctomycetota bacterium]
MPEAQKTIDLRSDTVTVPTEPMREAMAEAEVGDDVYGEDPSVNRLEATAAALLSMEAAVFVPSGTMGNLVALKTHTRPGDEVIMDADSHCYHYEGDGYAAVAGVGVRLIKSKRGVIRPQQIPPLVRQKDAHFARSRLVVVENTHNRGGGEPYPVETVAGIRDVCHKHGLSLHMDGARLFNACVATGAQPADYARHVDSVSVCLSKGLGCPVGTLLVGDRRFIDRARRWRKVLGGGMRQAGYLAAAGSYALENHVGRLAEDHENARRLADGIRGCEGLELRYDPPATNMVYFDLLPPHVPDRFGSALAAEGVRAGNAGGKTFRAVTHVGITAEDVDRVIGAIRRALQ